MEKKIWEIPHTVIDGASDKGAETLSTKKVLHPYLKTNEKNPAPVASNTTGVINAAMVQP